MTTYYQPWYLDVVWKMKIAGVMERQANRSKSVRAHLRWMNARNNLIRQAAALIEW